MAKQPKSQPAPRDDEAQAQALASLALDTIRAHSEPPELQRAVRRHLQQREDEVLAEAIERARDMDDDAWQLLRDTVDEASSSHVLRQPGRPDMEVNAFAIPVFVRSLGGLKPEESFCDVPAFEALLASFTEAGLESATAQVVLVQHWYDLTEAERIGYSALHAIVREAAVAMTDKKLRAMPALEASMPGWAPTEFAQDDEALELRFLLGFACKRTVDPFYQVPADEAAADAYFARRAERFRKWCRDAEALVQRCLAPAGRAPAVNFLYQDLFHGAREQGAAELAVLRAMAAVNAVLAEHGLAPEQVRASVGGSADLALIELFGPDGAALATLEAEADPAELTDALASQGLRAD